MGDQEPSFRTMPEGMHYKSAMGKRFLGAWDALEDRTLTIIKAELADLPGIPGMGVKSNTATALSFHGTKKKLLVNATIGETIARIAGTPKPLEWAKKKVRITIYATTDRGQGGKQVECVRVRPTAPKGPDTGVPNLPIDEAMIARQAEAMGHTAETPYVPASDEPAAREPGED